METDKKRVPLDKAGDTLRKKFGAKLELAETSGSLALGGSAASWKAKIDAGWEAARLGYRNVINDIAVPEVEEERLRPPLLTDGFLHGREFDVAIIGGGILGASIARELSRWDLSIVLLEKEYDLAVHTSSRNDGMIHDGFAAKPGSKKADCNVRGNRLWEPLCHTLGIEFIRPGSLILFKAATSSVVYPMMAARAKKNNVDGWEYWSRKKVKAEEPNVTDDQHGAFFLPSAGVLSPYKATVALAENAVANGAKVVFNACVTGMDTSNGKITEIQTNRGRLRASVVVNAAGNWADVVAGMAGDRFFSLHQRRGTELILDVSTGATQSHIMGMPDLMQIKSKTKGGGLVKTIEGNILVGPTAFEAPGREAYATASQDVRELEKHLALNTKLSLSQVITYFTGIRPCTYTEDFIIEKSRKISNLVHVAGIQSPGLASAPAIACDVAALVLSIVAGFKETKRRPGWNPTRTAPPELRRLSFEERAGIIEARPAYGRIVCRCEEVSEGEIQDALASALPISSMDGVKRRSRAGMGRCHGGFCTPRVMEIISVQKKIPLACVEKKGPGSGLCVGETKGARP